jgi:hypothetical protein
MGKVKAQIHEVLSKETRGSRIHDERKPRFKNCCKTKLLNHESVRKKLPIHESVKKETPDSRIREKRNSRFSNP